MMPEATRNIQAWPLFRIGKHVLPFALDDDRVLDFRSDNARIPRKQLIVAHHGGAPGVDHVVAARVAERAALMMLRPFVPVARFRIGRDPAGENVGCALGKVAAINAAFTSAQAWCRRRNSASGSPNETIRDSETIRPPCSEQRASKARFGFFVVGAGCR